MANDRHGGSERSSYPTYGHRPDRREEVGWEDEKKEEELLPTFRMKTLPRPETVHRLSTVDDKTVGASSS